MSKIPSITTSEPLQIRTVRAKIELLAKKVGFLSLIIIESIAISGIFALVVFYCPLPKEALFVSPFISGILTALALLQIPTFKITPVSYQTYLNPLALVGIAQTLVLFGGLILIKDQIDWTNYSDPLTARKIRTDLLCSSFEEICEVYGKNIHNLKNFGYLTKKQATEMKKIYRDYHPLLLAKMIYENSKSKKNLDNDDSPTEIEYQRIATEMTELEDRWETLKNSMQTTLPQPACPDFTKISNRWMHKFHQLVA